MGQSQFLGDHPAHRVAGDVGLGYPDHVEEYRCVLSHLADAVRVVGGRTASHSSVVEGNHLVLLGQGSHNLAPDRQVAGKASDQEQRLAGSFDIVVDVDAVRLNFGHEGLLSSVVRKGFLDRPRLALILPTAVQDR